jgi:predicted transcriptional regulator
MKKSVAINALEELPKEFDLDIYLEKLIVIEKIDLGLSDIKSGKVLNHESVKRLVKKWQK